ncbi:hypothetical protein QBC34DRAFT_207178 [Podospora aff. communis PSN243]|uniref:Uncharacterized protein n=1 Tax=Podospora aff. communis PSN243 TaxID=3040156 RepID=A0AAV9H0H7_9PEZI|nr:hypothetical protein QBC34DRAFT_207178 [Podospora aff. communis PSN243]
MLTDCRDSLQIFNDDFSYQTSLGRIQQTDKILREATQTAACTIHKLLGAPGEPVRLSKFSSPLPIPVPRNSILSKARNPSPFRGLRPGHCSPLLRTAWRVWRPQSPACYLYFALARAHFQTGRNYRCCSRENDVAFWLGSSPLAKSVTERLRSRDNLKDCYPVSTSIVYSGRRNLYCTKDWAVITKPATSPAFISLSGESRRNSELFVLCSYVLGRVPAMSFVPGEQAGLHSGCVRKLQRQRMAPGVTRRACAPYFLPGGGTSGDGQWKERKQQKYTSVAVSC